jgi:DNA-binding PadR family transcriptional regulator
VRADLKVRAYRRLTADRAAADSADNVSSTSLQCRLVMHLGEFEALVLMAVLHLKKDATGTHIRDEIERRAGRAVGRGAVYVTLDRLDDKGLLSSRQSAGAPERGGHPRRTFAVTPAGLRALRHTVASFANMQAGLEAVLKIAEPRP